MKQNEITVSRKSAIFTIGFVIFMTLLVLAVRSPLARSGQSPNTSIDASNRVAGSPEKFALLSGQSGERSVSST